MSGNDDFFGGSIAPKTPAPAPAPTAGDQPVASNVYAAPNASLTPHTTEGSRATPARPIILVVACTLLAFFAFVGFRVITSGTHIVLPDELLGLERVDQDSELTQGLEANWSKVAPFIGPDVEIELAAYTGDGQVLVVAAAEAGVSDPVEQDGLFTGIAEGFGESGPQEQFIEAEPGASGGRMQCLNTAFTGTAAGACTWISEDTFGMVILIAPQTDIAESTRTVRAEIER